MAQRRALDSMLRNPAAHPHLTRAAALATRLSRDVRATGQSCAQ
jgi:hypothetical protein